MALHERLIVGHDFIFDFTALVQSGVVNAIPQNPVRKGFYKLGATMIFANKSRLSISFNCLSCDLFRIKVGKF